MFFHAYKYKLKSLFREKETFFWIMIFPLILGTFFFMAFSKIAASTESFSTINVAVCMDDNDSNSMFKEMLENVYTDADKTIPFYQKGNSFPFRPLVVHQQNLVLFHSIPYFYSFLYNTTL